MTDSSHDFLKVIKRGNLPLFLLSDAVFSEVSKKIHGITVLGSEKKEEILKQVKDYGLDALMLQALRTPEVLSVLRELATSLSTAGQAIFFECLIRVCNNRFQMKDSEEGKISGLDQAIPELIALLPVALQIKVFQKLYKEDENALMRIAKMAPDAVPTALRLISNFPLPIQEELFKHVNSYGENALMSIIKHAKGAILPALNLIKTFSTKTKIGEIFTQVNNNSDEFDSGENAFIYIISHARELIPTALEFIKDLPLALQMQIFKETYFAGRNALMGIALKAPEAVPTALKIIKGFPEAARIKIFKQRSKFGWSALNFVACWAEKAVPLMLEFINEIPSAERIAIFKPTNDDESTALMDIARLNAKALPAWLKLIKQFPEAVWEKIIQHKDISGKGLEFYLVANGDVALLNNLCSMGFIFNRRARNNEGDGLLEKALESDNPLKMIETLISSYGVKPDLRTKNKLLQYLKDTGSDEAFAKKYTPALDFAHLMKLYDTYLMSVVAPEALFALKTKVLPDISSIVLSYLSHNTSEELKDPEVNKALEASIDRALKQRVELLKPLIDYCDRNDSDAEAATILKDLLASKRLGSSGEETQLRLGPQGLEERLNETLKERGIAEKSYSPYLISCLLNTAKISKNKLNLPIDCKKILDRMTLELKKQLEMYAFKFKVLSTCAAISTTTLILGLVAATLFHLVAVGVAIATCSALVLGRSAYGLYAHKKNTGPQSAADREQYTGILSNVAS